MLQDKVKTSLTVSKIRSDSTSPDYSSQVTLYKYSTFKTTSDDQSIIQA